MTSKETKQRYAERMLREWLATRALPEGTRLPTILELASELGVKERPTRQALDLLRAEGKIHARGNRGLFVGPPPTAGKTRCVLFSDSFYPRDAYDAKNWYLRSELLDGVMEAAGQWDWDIIPTVVENGAEPVETLVRKVEESGSVSVIGVGYLGDSKFYGLGERIGFYRIVDLGCSAPPSCFNNARIREETGIRQALMAAYELGHRRFAMLYSHNLGENISHAKRFQAFAAFCHDTGVRLGPDMVLETRGEAMDGYRAANILLSAETPPTLIFSVTDERARGVLRALTDRGLTPGGEVSVVGYDDMPEAMSLGLATVHVPRREIGRKAIELSRTALEKKTVQPIAWFDTSLIVRPTLGKASAS